METNLSEQGREPVKLSPHLYTKVSYRPETLVGGEGSQHCANAAPRSGLSLTLNYSFKLSNVNQVGQKATII